LSSLDFILWIWIFLVFFWIKKQFNLFQIGNYVLDLCGGGNRGGNGVRVSGVSGVSAVGIRVSGVSVACIVGRSVPGVGNLKQEMKKQWSKT
jgi:hypothetical protein